MDQQPTLEELYMYPGKTEPEESEENKSEHEIHCSKCVSVKKCAKLNILKSNEPKSVIECPIVLCRLSCGREFHECKQDEHKLLCPNAKVECINANYGCPLVMERRKIGWHLKTCPASVVVCTMEWNRWPLPSDEAGRIPYELNSDQLDTAFLERDQRTVVEWWQKLPSRLRSCLKTALNSKYPVMPLGVSGNRIPHCIQEENLLEKVTGGLPVAEGETTDDSSETPWGAKRSPPGLQESVCNKLTSSGDNHMDRAEAQDNSQQQKDEIIINPHLSPVIEIVPRSKIKPRNIFTFMCAREFRRDEYAGHFRDVHSGVLTQLNGWLYNRCPLANQGCCFGLERLHPNKSDQKIIYNKDLDAFCSTQVVPSSAEPSSNHDGANGTQDLPEEDRPVSLCDLPFEVLVHLTKYLDPLSLSSLAMTNTLLRKVCAFVVVSRGIVVLQWERNTQNGSWESLEKKWIFSTSFSPIRKWTFADVGRLGNHMMNCPKFERNVPSEPFCYPVKLEDVL